MSLTSEALKAGAAVMFNPVIAGETVTFRGEDTGVHVDRLGGEGTEPGQQIKVNTRESVNVEFPIDIDQPTAGETMTTENGDVYRIESVRSLGFAWRCGCSVKR